MDLELVELNRRIYHAATSSRRRPSSQLRRNVLAAQAVGSRKYFVWGIRTCDRRCVARSSSLFNVAAYDAAYVAAYDRGFRGLVCVCVCVLHGYYPQARNPDSSRNSCWIWNSLSSTDGCVCVCYMGTIHKPETLTPAVTPAGSGTR
jgi:hypothetical protein